MNLELGCSQFLKLDTAYKVARLLNLHKLHGVGDQAGPSSIADELKRRCFWSCWATSCISQTNAYFKSDPWKEVVGLPFPAAETSWTMGRPVTCGCFNERGEVACTPGAADKECEPSIMAEFVKLYCLWYILPA